MIIKMAWLSAVVLGMTGSFAVGQSRLELPLDADNCAIHNALSPETSGSCWGNVNGPTRGIVLRIDDALTGTGVSQPAGSVQSLLQRPIAPTVRVALAAPERIIKNGASPRPASHAAAESKDGYFVQFAFDSSLLEPRFKEHLNRLSEVLTVQAMATSCIKIIGHTDTVGEAGYNLRLSNRRAQSVASYLKESRSIPPRRISIEAAGELRPLPDIRGDSALNRRVEFATKESPDGC